MARKKIFLQIGQVYIRDHITCKQESSPNNKICAARIPRMNIPGL